MSSNWARKHPRWSPHFDGGVTYSLTHLHPFKFEIVLPKSKRYEAKSVEIQVVFSHHTFTRTIEKGDAGIAPYAGRPNEPRIFCTERYALSKGLRDIIQGLSDRTCYHADRENYFTVEGVQVGSEYRVYFDVRHIGSDCAALIYVQSAYSAYRNQSQGGMRHSVRFRVLLNYALQNKRHNQPGQKSKPRN